MNQAHAFVSYMREDESVVQKLCSALRARNVDVWLDRDSIDPGQNWQKAIQSAIEQGAFFLACFSAAFHRRRDTYMHQELTWAAARIRVPESRSGWLIPIRLSECPLPNLDLGGVKSVVYLQWIDLFRNWDDGVNRILRVVRPYTYVPPGLERFLRDGCARHIESKIELFAAQGGKRIKEVEDEWRGLMDPFVWNLTVELATMQLTLCRVAGKPLTDRIVDARPMGRVILVTAASTTDTLVLLRSFEGGDVSLEHKYGHLIQHERRRMREQLPGWKDRALVHWIFSEDKTTNELVVDLLYLHSFNLSLKLLAYQLYLKEKHSEPPPPVGQIYPTSIVGVREIEHVVAAIMHEEALFSRSQG